MLTRDNIRILLNKIDSSLGENEYSDIFLARIECDLKKVDERLINREYERFNPSPNILNVKDRHHTFVTEIDFYGQLGKLWAALLKPFKLDATSTIIDLCPGAIPKIELGLARLGFCGSLDIIDKSQSAIADFQKFMGFINPPFSFSTSCTSIDEIPSEKKYSCILANHILDDILLDLASEKEALSIANVYADEYCFRQVWNKIMANDVWYTSRATELLLNVFSKISATGSIVVWAEYESYVNRALNLDDATLFTRKLFEKIQDKLSEKYFDKSGLAGATSRIELPDDSYFKRKNVAFMQRK